MSKLLGLDLSYFHGIVWFGPDSELKTKDELPDFVMNSGLIPYIEDKNQLLLSQEQVLKIVEMIETNKFEKTLATYFSHQENVKKHIDDKKNNPTCPYCQSPMIKRTAKQGNYANQEFWGCSRYPSCRGIRNVEF